MKAIDLQKFETEKYLKNCLCSFIVEKGLLKEYNDSWRYKYASQNKDDFKRTNIYPQWLEARKEVLRKELECLENNFLTMSANPL